VRVRLNVLLTAVLATALLALGVPLALVSRNALTHQLFVDRLNDTTRFAAVAAQEDEASALDLLAAQFARYQAVYGISCYLVANTGTVRVASGLEPLPHGAWATRIVSAALGGRHSDTTPTQWPWDTRPMIVAEPIDRGGDVVGAVVTVSATDRLRHRVWTEWAVLSGAGLALLVGCFFLADRLARWVLRPLRELAAVTREVSNGRLATRVAAAGPPEVRNLAGSFNTMAERVHESMERQRRFVADASHQLRNPLAALTIRLDDLAARVDTDLRRDAEEAIHESRRLAGMLERMLELARSERSERPVIEQSLAPIVTSRVGAWTPVARSRGIELRLDPFGDVRAACSAEALGEALDAVLDNALKFAPESSVVDVRCFVEPGEVVLCVRDDGDGLAPDELERIGHRFWRSAAHQNVSGFGLGLSIVRASLEPAGGRLAAVSPPGGGLEVRLVLPRSRPATASPSGTTPAQPGAAEPAR
jgi:signal transduction histidine kinase